MEGLLEVRESRGRSCCFPLGGELLEGSPKAWRGRAGYHSRIISSYWVGPLVSSLLKPSLRHLSLHLPQGTRFLSQLFLPFQSQSDLVFFGERYDSCRRISLNGIIAE